MARVKIPNHIKTAVLLESGYKCANPVCRHVLTLELHHIVWVKDGGSNDPENLLVLCPNCHSLHTQGHIPEAAILAWKNQLVVLNNTNPNTADFLLVIAEDEERVTSSETEEDIPRRFRFTGDSLPLLSGLLTSGLITISKRYSGSNIFGGTLPSFEVELTDKGKLYVEAWKGSGIHPIDQNGQEGT
ncbi:MAG: HNH endonuclease signature motif containing protein [Candidatus Thiodiazotropha endolucinida]